MNKTVKQRDVSLDLIRIMACIMVIMMHSPIPEANANAYFLSGLSYLTAPCIGLFFMVSGALLLPSPNASKTEAALPFLQKRLKRVLMPTLVWTLFYIAVKFCDGDITTEQMFKSIISIPFSAQGHGILWFMYTLIGLYLVTPILCAWLKNVEEREIRFYLLLWLIVMCYPVLSLVVNVNDTPTGILYYFSGYIGYYVLGYWLKHYGEKISIKIATILMGISVAVPIYVKLMHYTVDFDVMFWYLSIFVAIQCVFWWKVIKFFSATILFSNRATKVITLFSNLSFGIYLSHIFFMRHLIWKVPIIVNIHSQILKTFVVIIFTLILSFAATWALSITPLGNITVGWRKKH